MARAIDNSDLFNKDGSVTDKYLELAKMSRNTPETRAREARMGVTSSSSLNDIIGAVLGQARINFDENMALRNKELIQKGEIAQLQFGPNSNTMGVARLQHGEGGSIDRTNQAQERIQDLVNTGALARQKLINEGASDVANIGMISDRYKADKTLEGVGVHSKAIVEAYQGRANDPNKVLEEMIKSGTLTTPEEILAMRKRLLSQNKLDSISKDDVSKFDLPDNNTSTVPTSVIPKPKTSVNNVPTPTPITRTPRDLSPINQQSVEASQNWDNAIRNSPGMIGRSLLSAGRRARDLGLGVADTAQKIGSGLWESANTIRNRM